MSSSRGQKYCPKCPRFFWHPLEHILGKQVLPAYCFQVWKWKVRICSKSVNCFLLKFCLQLFSRLGSKYKPWISSQLTVAQRFDGVWGIFFEKARLWEIQLAYFLHFGYHHSTHDLRQLLISHHRRLSNQSQRNPCNITLLLGQCWEKNDSILAALTIPTLKPFHNSPIYNECQTQST